MAVAGQPRLWYYRPSLAGGCEINFDSVVLAVVIREQRSDPAAYSVQQLDSNATAGTDSDPPELDCGTVDRPRHCPDRCTVSQSGIGWILRVAPLWYDVVEISGPDVLHELVELVVAEAAFRRRTVPRV